MGWEVGAAGEGEMDLKEGRQEGKMDLKGTHKTLASHLPCLSGEPSGRR